MKPIDIILQIPADFDSWCYTNLAEVQHKMVHGAMYLLDNPHLPSIELYRFYNHNHWRIGGIVIEAKNIVGVLNTAHTYFIDKGMFYDAKMVKLIIDTIDSVKPDQRTESPPIQRRHVV
jgi:hypothetical protein